jgi:hypothetical protein
MKRSGYFQKVEIEESKQDERATSGVVTYTFKLNAEIAPPTAASAGQAKPASAPAQSAAAPAKKG